MTKILNGVTMTDTQAEAVANADAQLNNVGFTNYTQTCEQIERMADSARNTLKLEGEIQAQLVKLLERARLYIDAGEHSAARQIIDSLITNRSN